MVFCMTAFPNSGLIVPVPDSFSQYILHTIDGDLEYHNPVESATASCPLLPGQKVNILEVPVQVNLVAGRNVSSTSVDSLVFTLDPKDKYLPPGVRRASTTSAIKKRKAQHGPAPKIIHRSASNPMCVETPPQTATSARAGQSTLDRQHSLISVFHRIRRIRSAGSNTKSGVSWPRKIFSSEGESTKDEDVPKVPKIPSQYVPGARNDHDLELPIQRPQSLCTPDAVASACSATPIGLVNPSGSLDKTSVNDDQHVSSQLQDADPEGPVTTTPSDSPGSLEVRYFTPPEHLRAHSTYFEATSFAAENSLPSSIQGAVPESGSSRDHPNPRTAEIQPSQQSESVARTSLVPQISAEQQIVEHEVHVPAYAYPDSSLASPIDPDNFTPDFASHSTNSGPMSPLHLSQPETPITVDFVEDYRDAFDIIADPVSYAQLDTSFGAKTELLTPRPPSRAPPPPPPQVQKPMTPRWARSGFQGYSLPDEDHASILTIRKLPSTSLKPLNEPTSVSSQAENHTFVHPWKNSSEPLLDDLGYLRELIN